MEGYTYLDGEDRGGIEGFPDGRTSTFGRHCLPSNQTLLVLHSFYSLILITDTHASFQKQGKKFFSRLCYEHCFVGGGSGDTCATIRG